MAGRHFLFVPGPTNVPERVLRAMHRSMEDHRSSAFPALTHGLLRDLRPLFGTALGTPVIFPATGSAGWEIALTNTLAPGDRVLAVRNGQFSHLFTDAAQRLGFTCDTIDVEWGEGVPADRVAEQLALDHAHEIRAVLVVHNETATGVASDMAAVRAAIDGARHPALLFVDGVSSIGSLPFDFDAWGVDVAITGSQKGLMLPAGLAIVCLSAKARALVERAQAPRAFLDLRPMIRSNETGYFPYTPPLSLLFGLREVLDMLAEEGLPNTFARHARLADGVRAAVRAWALPLCARDPALYSNSVSTILTPEGVDSARVVDVAFRRWNLSLGAGLARLAGRAFRIGHLGDLNELMLLGALGGVELSLHDAGASMRLGSGVAAAQALWSAAPSSDDGAAPAGGAPTGGAAAVAAGAERSAGA